MSKLAYIRSPEPILFHDSDLELKKCLVENYDQFKINDERHNVNSIFLDGPLDNFNLKIGFYVITGRHPITKLAPLELKRKSHLRAILFCVRDLGIYSRIELCKTFVILNHFQPKFELFDTANGEIWDSYLMNVSDVTKGIGLKFFLNKDELNFKDYVDQKFQSLGPHDFAEIFIQERINERVRFGLAEQKLKRYENFEDNQPDMSDAFDDYDQFETWSYSR